MYTEPQKTSNRQNILLKMNKAGDLIIPDFKRYYKAKVIKTVCCRYKDRYIEKWNRLKSSEKSMYIGSNDVIKNSKNTWEKDGLFNKWNWKNWTSTCKCLKLDSYFTWYTKISSKWIKVLNNKAWNSKPPRRKYKGKISSHLYW